MSTMENDQPRALYSLYRERAALVAFLAAVFPAVIASNDPEEPDWPVIYITTPAGQMTWHLSPGDLDLFQHVDQVAADDPRAQWDRHTTAEKYQRLEELTTTVQAAFGMLGWRPLSANSWSRFLASIY